MEQVNEHVQFDNPNRPTRVYGKASHLLRCIWLIYTNTSRPRTSPRAVAAHIVDRILELRATQGVRIMRLNEGDKVVSMVLVDKTEEAIQS